MKKFKTLDNQKISCISGGGNPYEEPWRKPSPNGVGQKNPKWAVKCAIGTTNALLNKNPWALAACIP